MISIGAAFALEGVHGAESLAVSEILYKAQRDQRNGHQGEHVGMSEAGQRAQQRDDRAGSGDHGETERIDLAALDESGEFFAVDAFCHGKGSLLGEEYQR